MPRPLYPSTHCQGGLVSPSASLDGAENLSSTGIQFPDRPARSEYSLYLLTTLSRPTLKKGQERDLEHKDIQAGSKIFY
jgi:hypothetical protein